jgi:hypothetical protein
VSLEVELSVDLPRTTPPKEFHIKDIDYYNIKAQFTKSNY